MAQAEERVRQLQRARQRHLAAARRLLLEISALLGAEAGARFGKTRVAWVERATG